MILAKPAFSTDNDFYTVMVERSSFKKEENKILLGFIVSLLSLVVLVFIYLDFGVPFIKSASSSFNEQVSNPKEYPRVSINV